jgi:hypothetical protein
MQVFANHPSLEVVRRLRKKRKDPNAPKRASNAYMIFCKEHRNQLKEERPDLAFGKLGAKLGEIWRTMSVEEKMPYEERALSDRERYKRELAVGLLMPADEDYLTGIVLTPS